MDQYSQNAKQVLYKHGLRPKDKFGQNFLVDQVVVDEIINLAELKPTDEVVEIGAGTGVLTSKILPKVKQLFSYEIDAQLISVLQKNFVAYSNLELMNVDILKFSPDEIGLENTDYKVIGSIPYQITSPLLHHFLTLGTHPKLMVLLVQKEVAEKICTPAPDASYLSTLVASYGKASLERLVKPKSFYPIPKVDSAIIKIVIRAENPVIDFAGWQKFLHHGFMQPRKMLNKRFDKNVLEVAGIEPTRRAQTLSLKEWRRLYQKANLFS